MALQIIAAGLNLPEGAVCLELSQGVLPLPGFRMVGSAITDAKALPGVRAGQPAAIWTFESFMKFLFGLREMKIRHLVRQAPDFLLGLLCRLVLGPELFHSAIHLIGIDGL